MFRIIVNAPNGEQEIHMIEWSGGYYDDSKIVWHEGRDGVIPPDKLPSLGGLVRQGKELVVDAGMLSQAQARAVSRANSESQRNTRVSQAKAALNAADFSSPLTAAQLTQLVRAIFIILKDLDRKL